jgi:hypothetical protein
MRVFRRLVSLSQSERRSLLEAGFWVMAVRLGLWVLPFSIVWHGTRTAAQRRRRLAQADTARATRGAWAVRVVSRYVPQATCLTQSLALFGILQRSGIDCELRIGVARAGEDRLAAHAWVDDHGKVLPPSEDAASYSVFPDWKG